MAEQLEALRKSLSLGDPEVAAINHNYLGAIVNALNASGFEIKPEEEGPRRRIIEVATVKVKSLTSSTAGDMLTLVDGDDETHMFINNEFDDINYDELRSLASEGDYVNIALVKYEDA